MEMKNKEFWDETGKVLLWIALVVGGLSLFMNISTMTMEKNAAAPAAPTPTEQTSVIKILAAGSADYGTVATSTSDYDAIFAGIKPVVANYELAAYSQKSLIGTDTKEEFGTALTGLGFDMIGLANPSCLKSGKAGIDSSLAYWSAQDVSVSGTNASTDDQNRIIVKTVQDISYVYLSFTDQLSTDLPEAENYLVNVYDEERSPEIVAKAAQQADIVIVSIAWDGTDKEGPNDRQSTIAHELADAGASVIIGNAGDAIQPVEWIDDTLVFYSLGDLVSDQAGASTHLGAMGALTVTKTTYQDKKKIELIQPCVDLTVTVNESPNFRVYMLNDASDAAVPNKSSVYSEYSAVLQKLDDSIRIGGLQ